MPRRTASFSGLSHALLEWQSPDDIIIAVPTADVEADAPETSQDPHGDDPAAPASATDAAERANTEDAAQPDTGDTEQPNADGSEDADQPGTDHQPDTDQQPDAERSDEHEGEPAPPPPPPGLEGDPGPDAQAEPEASELAEEPRAPSSYDVTETAADDLADAAGADQAPADEPPEGEDHGTGDLPSGTTRQQLVKVVNADNEEKIYNITVVRPDAKPFLGGYRHKNTRVEYHNASTQTPRRIRNPGVSQRRPHPLHCFHPNLARFLPLMIAPRRPSSSTAPHRPPSSAPNPSSLPKPPSTPPRKWYVPRLARSSFCILPSLPVPIRLCTYVQTRSGCYVTTAQDRILSGTTYETAEEWHRRIVAAVGQGPKCRLSEREPALMPRLARRCVWCVGFLGGGDSNLFPTLEGKTDGSEPAICPVRVPALAAGDRTAPARGRTARAGVGHVQVHRPRLTTLQRRPAHSVSACAGGSTREIK